ncbi:hypothetical protein [Bacillus sp. AFS041924]|uniref:hypothetical protein n=1 Tax=Bacillus sp. AFS041924 TaxID=2033503 RepID=UPI000BFE7325|nr:hypothetical protein [Bacillus sp. AFS041924]PGS50585.1 hypothetical protein COC46_12605 [Bacillus sp. AFS041924]
MTNYCEYAQIGTEQIERLSSLLWLSGCINWNFFKTTSELIKTNEEKLNTHLNYYLQRGKKLEELLR